MKKELLITKLQLLCLTSYEEGLKREDWNGDKVKNKILTLLEQYGQ